MRPDGLTARGWVRCAEEVLHYERQHHRRILGGLPTRDARDTAALYRARLARIEARARREAAR